MSAAPFSHFESSNDGLTFQPVADLPSTRVAQQTVSFPPVTARYFRLKIESAPASSMLDAFEPAPGADPGLFGAMMTAPKADAEINELIRHTAPRVNRFEEKAASAWLTITTPFPVHQSPPKQQLLLPTWSTLPHL